MADQLQLRGGTTAKSNVFTGAQREVTVDTDKKTLVVHDNFTAGGFPLATESKVSNGTFYFNDNVAGGSAANSYVLAAKANTNRPTQYLDGIQLGFVTANANVAGPSSANFSGLGVKSIKYPGGVDPAAGDIFGRVYLIYDQTNDWLELQRKAAAPPPQLRAITASVSGNALTVTMPPSIVTFRSPSLPNGSVNERTVTAALNLVVPAGATLGTSSGVAARIVVLAVDNGGVVSLAVVNQSTTQALDETNLVNTVAIGAGSSSSNTVYASSSLSGVPYRVLGYIDSIQPTAGSWTITPSQVQPIGGQIILKIPQIVLVASQSTTAGTSIDFTGIPANTKKIMFSMNNVSTSGTSPLVIRLGSSAGIETVGYGCGVANVNTGSTGSSSETTGLRLSVDHFSGSTLFGQVSIAYMSLNQWSFSSNVARGGAAMAFSAGIKVMSGGTLDRVRITTLNGTDTFVAGAVNIIYEA